MATPEEILTPEQEAAEQEAYNKVFFSEGEDDGEGRESGAQNENEEADQGHQEEEAGREPGDGLSGDKEVEAAAEGEEPESKASEQKFKIKWNGEDIEVTHDEMIALGQKGFDYTAKMQNIAKYRKDLEAAGVNDEAIELLKGMKAGDRAAALKFVERFGIDPVDLIGIEEKEINSNPPRKTDDEIVVSQQVAPLIEQVMSNPSLQSKMERAEGYLPRRVIERMAQDPDLLYAAVSEVETGSFDQVMPRVQMRLATMTDLDREYVMNSPEMFGNIYFEEKSMISAAPAAQKPAVQQQATTKPNMSEVGVKRTPGSFRKEAVIKDAFTDDDEYKKILDRVRNNR